MKHQFFSDLRLKSRCTSNVTILVWLNIETPVHVRLKFVTRLGTERVRYWLTSVIGPEPVFLAEAGREREKLHDSRPASRLKHRFSSDILVLFRFPLETPVPVQFKIIVQFRVGTPVLVRLLDSRPDYG